MDQADFVVDSLGIDGQRLGLKSSVLEKAQEQRVKLGWGYFKAGIEPVFTLVELGKMARK